MNHRAGWDFIAVVTPNPEVRDYSLVRCKYFTSCRFRYHELWIPVPDALVRKHLVVRRVTSPTSRPPRFPRLS
ncbi:hypothetical protein B0H17DRAFT_1212702 [Mycena rosella]|uniref:Uncharacterized protein n=1 Tax=Mycena rosella TaxID=1033263 RepID=A0AAD7CRS0_MYCRO|nr:hypothetical protein B0H17DRAFT_1212702 [Mycena rosella]